MSTKIEVGEIVVQEGLIGVYRVVKVSADGKTADIEQFDVSKQRSLGDPVRTAATEKLSAYRENASEAKARMVRETTTEEN